MCIDMEYRSLKGGYHEKIYEYFEKNNLCKKYVENTCFQNYLQGQKADLRSRAITNKEGYSELVEAVERFVEDYEDWSKELRTHSVSGIFRILQEEGVLKGVEDFRKLPVCKGKLYFHLGIIVLDRIEAAKSIAELQSK